MRVRAGLLLVAWLAIVCAAPTAAGAARSQKWPLGLYGSGPDQIIAHPHVAFVLVGNWGRLPARAPTDPCANANAKNATPTPQQFLGALLCVSDQYGTPYDAPLSKFYGNCGPFGFGCTYVGRGVVLDRYSDRRTGRDTPWSGPFSLPACTSAKAVGASGCSSQLDSKLSAVSRRLVGGGKGHPSSDQNTVFVLVFPTGRLTCAGDYPYHNQSFRAFHLAVVSLEDSRHHCESFHNAGLLTVVSPLQFLTWATSHEIDEAITSPPLHYGWLVPEPGTAEQIADVCQLRDVAGDTGPPGSYQLGNFTRDSRGIVMAAYVDPKSDECTPRAATAILPQIYFKVDAGRVYPCHCDFGAPNARTNAVVRPASLVPAPADPPYATDLRSWKSWGAARTSSTGTLYYDTCSPACSAGYHHTRGRATLSQVRDCGGRLYYTKVSFTYFTKPKYDSVFTFDCAGRFTGVTVGGH